MMKSATGSATAALAAALALHAFLPVMPAQAASKVWVSNSGVDSGTCGAVASPCATFQQAHNNVAVGGEIGVLTPGDYGGTGNARVNISKSVFVTNDGSGEATISTNGGGEGIDVDVGAGGIVGLRGLILDGQASANEGIGIHAAAAVHIQNCVIRNFEQSGFGIVLESSVNTQLFVSDSIVFNNGSAASTGGILITPFTTAVSVVIDRVHLENNVVGLLVDGTAGTGNGAHVIVRDSVISGNASDGIRAVSASGKAPAFIVVERSSSVNNGGIGINANGPHATIVLNDDTISRNGTGIAAVNSGQIISFGNNKNFNNIGAEGAPTGLFSQM